jgi:hypothetical protein
MDEFSATLRRISKFLNWQRANAPTASLTRLEDRYPSTRPYKLARSHQSSSAGTNDQDIGWM